MRQRDVIRQFDTRELMEWMSYDMAQDDDFREKVLLENCISAQKNNTGEQEAELIRNMFSGMSNATNK